MHRTLPTFALLSLCTLAGAQRFDASRTGLPERSAKVVSYTMRVRLDPVTKQVTGTQQIGYRNITRGRTNELRWHMYLNAFRNLRSTHLRESDAAARERYKTKIEFGEVRFLRLTSVDYGREHDLLPGLRWVQPDDGNPDDRTVCVVPLPGTLEPGETIHLETEFVAKLPKAYRRTGWGPGNFFMVAQWFPKLGVLEDAGSGKAWWNCHQFHAWTEFFADYFGSAGEDMRRFYQRISDINRDEGVIGTSRETSWGTLGTAERMTLLGADIQAATDAAADGVERRRVDTWRRGIWDYMREGFDQYAAGGE